MKFMPDALNCRSRRDARPGAQRGFTLLELMIVVLVIAVLGAIAITSYGYATRKSRRSAAQGCLVERAQYMERFYATNMAYDKTTAGADVVLPACSTDVSKYFDNGALGTGGGFSVAPTPSAFTLQLLPKGDQVKDTVCGPASTGMTVNQLGTKVPTTGCW